MQVMFDSRVGRPTIIGDHDGTPRIWTVTVRMDGFPDKLMFRPKEKTYIRELATLIDNYMLAESIEQSIPIGRVRWTAIAR